MANLSRFGEPSLPVLVLLHGFLGSKEDWLNLMPQLSRHFYCVCLDLPGHGGHARQVLPIPGFDACVQDILARLDALGIGNFHLLGYSLGGRIALHLADFLARHQVTRLLSLTLESCHPGLERQRDRALRSEQDAVWAGRLSSLALREFLSLWYHQSVFVDLNVDERRSLCRLRMNNSAPGLRNCFEATSLALQESLWQLPLRLACPSYFFCGSHDTQYLAIGKRWHAETGIGLQSFAHVGHNLHLAGPGPFCRILVRLLTDRPHPLA